jgi:hypothetical protein
MPQKMGMGLIKHEPHYMRWQRTLYANKKVLSKPSGALFGFIYLIEDTGQNHLIRKIFT